jgi:hypothetical protein
MPNPSSLPEPESRPTIVLVSDQKRMPSDREAIASTHHLAVTLSFTVAAAVILALIALAGCAAEDEPSICAVDSGVTRCALPE